MKQMDLIPKLLISLLKKNKTIFYWVCSSFLKILSSFQNWTAAIALFVKQKLIIFKLWFLLFEIGDVIKLER